MTRIKGQLNSQCLILNFNFVILALALICHLNFVIIWRVAVRAEPNYISICLLIEKATATADCEEMLFMDALTEFFHFGIVP